MTPKVDPAPTDLRRALSEAGLKVTHQRLEIWKAVSALHEHPTVLDVFERVRATIPTVSLDTVYRTLWTFSGLGLLNPVSTQGEAVRFDSDTARHHHYLCTQCGRTMDFHDPRLDALEIPEQARALGTVSGYLVEVRGICRSCSDEEHDTAVRPGSRKGERNV